MKKGQTKRYLKKPTPMYRKSKKRWLARVYMGNGKRVERWCRTKNEAFDKIDELWENKEAGIDGRTNVEAAVKTWLASGQGNWKANTRQDYLDTSKKFKPLLSIPLDDLSSDHIQQLLDTIKTSASRKRVRSTLRTLLNWCVRRKMLRFNPVIDTEPVRHIKQEIEVFDHDDVDAIVEELSDRWKSPVQLMLWLGLRPGECWALQWRDWTDGCLNIRRAVKEINGQGQVVEPVKTSAGRRTLPLSKGVEDLLHERRKAAMKAGHASKQDPIFANMRGGMVRHGNFRHKIWRKALMDADVEYKKPYTLRHTSATWMLNSGECSLAAVSKWLGHEDKVTTLRLYDHLMTGELQEVAKWWTKLQRA